MIGTPAHSVYGTDVQNYEKLPILTQDNMFCDKCRLLFAASSTILMFRQLGSSLDYGIFFFSQYSSVALCDNVHAITGCQINISILYCQGEIAWTVDPTHRKASD